MNIKIINKTDWSIVYVKLLDHKRNVTTEYELKFKENVSTLEIDLKKNKYLYLHNNKVSTEIIILSENLDTISLEYNPNKECYDAYLINSNITSYPQIETYTLKDEKNLYYRPEKSKVIHVLKPHNYDETKKYGLIIMFDGQNLFDKRNVGDYTKLNDPYGSWQVDVTTAKTREHFNKEYVIVGIETADELRMNELLMNKKFGKIRNDNLLPGLNLVGYLDDLDAFINKTLIPFVKNKYSVDLSNIGIGGSSAGGVASHYVGLKNLGKYKFILCFTPASGLYDDSLWEKFYKKIKLKKNPTKQPYFYYFQGKKDALEKLLFTYNANLISMLINNGYNENLIETYIEPEAYHNETAWRYGLNYLFYKLHENMNK